MEGIIRNKKNLRKIFITGIGTDVGKTLVSAIITESLQADYWKPVQTGTQTDSIEIAQLISNVKTKIHQESYHFKYPLSPHTAAELSQEQIDIDKIILPELSNNNLIIEGAGGLMVPLNQKHFIVDLIEKFEAETILVVKNYLGSINHTLLSVKLLESRKINTLGIIFNGEENKSSENLILNYSGLKCLGRINQEPTIDKKLVSKYARDFSFLR